MGSKRRGSSRVSKPSPAPAAEPESVALASAQVAGVPRGNAGATCTLRSALSYGALVSVLAFAIAVYWPRSERAAPHLSSSGTAGAGVQHTQQTPGLPAALVGEAGSPKKAESLPAPPTFDDGGRRRERVQGQSEGIDLHAKQSPAPTQIKPSMEKEKGCDPVSQRGEIPGQNENKGQNIVNERNVADLDPIALQDEIESLFGQFDLDLSGLLDASEAAAFLHGSGFSLSDHDQIFHQMDSDGDQALTTLEIFLWRSEHDTAWSAAGKERFVLPGKEQMIRSEHHVR